ncbi:hypothetical protein CC80DRAFT_75993 [Byssothecium circinans]|uniref:Uncharacterized protein n=1 Tax=Byssothecium circinans TaxID=147558 RepID=A0A6A5TXF7_9PLEO|nr:hypothetical protein CC80DRAFT_75993 [Byssothecium circinans]
MSKRDSRTANDNAPIDIDMDIKGAERLISISLQAATSIDATEDDAQSSCHRGRSKQEPFDTISSFAGFRRSWNERRGPYRRANSKDDTKHVPDAGPRISPILFWLT